MVVVIALLNLLISLLRLYYVAKSKRFISIVWFLIVYFSFFFVGLSQEDYITHIRGFTGETIKIDAPDIRSALFYAFAFNLIFLVSEYTIWKLIGPRHRQSIWVREGYDSYYRRLQYGFAFILIIGAVTYAVTTRDQTYRDFVEFKGSNWGQVFLLAGAPFITVAALRRKYLFALAGCLPFLYFAVKLHVRSFALLSLIPLFIIYISDFKYTGTPKLLLRVRRTVFILMLAGIAVGLSVVILSSKRQTGSLLSVEILPDSGMSYGFAIIKTLIDKYSVHTGFDAILLYWSNILTPFRKLLGLDAPNIVDPPTVMAAIFDAVPKWWDVYYHYPSLWYGDAYIAFGLYGLLLAFGWALVFCTMERIMSVSALIYTLALPTMVWHAYMVVRGATAGAAVPFSYSFYIVIITAMLLGGSQFFRAIMGRSHPNKRNYELAKSVILR